MKRRSFLKATVATTLLSPLVAAEDRATPFTLVVMDPLSKQLACDCVKGYAQRDYKALGKYLESRLGRPVSVEFGESLKATLENKTGGKADLVIGKESVVRNASSSLKLSLSPIAGLTGKDGKTSMTGLVVVSAKDPALSAGDLKGYKILFGLPDADEKYSVPMRYLQELGIKISEKPETCVSCSVGATRLIDLAKKGEKAAAVISSYAQPLLEGCGTINKGDLRIVGETDPVPFIVAFLNDKIPASDRETVLSALLSLGESKDLLAAMETKTGFERLATKKK